MNLRTYDEIFHELNLIRQRFLTEITAAMATISAPLKRASNGIRSLFRFFGAEKMYDRIVEGAQYFFKKCVAVIEAVASKTAEVVTHLATTVICTGVGVIEKIKSTIKESPQKAILAFGGVLLFAIMLPFLIKTLKIAIWTLLLSALIPLVLKIILQICI